MIDKIIDLIRNHPDQVTALAAVSALFVSLTSIILTVWALWLQRRHNYKSLTPIAYISVRDYENDLEVALKNDGIGPLLVERLIVARGNEEKSNVIGWMPAGIVWSAFVGIVEGRCIPANEEIVLLKLKGSSKDPEFCGHRDAVRRILAELEVTVKYRDIYQRRMADSRRELSWFKRNLSAPTIKGVRPIARELLAKEPDLNK